MRTNSNLGLNSKVKKKYNGIDLDQSVVSIAQDYTTIDRALNSLKIYASSRGYEVFVVSEEEFTTTEKYTKDLKNKVFIIKYYETFCVEIYSQYNKKIKFRITTYSTVRRRFSDAGPDLEYPHLKPLSMHKNLTKLLGLKLLKTSSSPVTFEDIKTIFDYIESHDANEVNEVNESTSLGLNSKVKKKYKDKSVEDVTDSMFYNFSDVSHSLESFKKFAEYKGFKVVDMYGPRKATSSEDTINVSCSDDNYFLAVIPYLAGNHYNGRKIVGNIRISIGYPAFSEIEEGCPFWWTSGANEKFNEYLEHKYPEVSAGTYSENPFDLEALRYIFDFVDISRKDNVRLMRESKSSLGLNSKVKEKHSSKTVDGETEIVGGCFSTIEEALEFIKDYADTKEWDIHCYTGRNFSYFNQYPKRTGFIRRKEFITGNAYNLFLKVVDGINYNLNVNSTYVSMYFIQDKEGKPLMVNTSSDSYSLEDCPRTMSSRDIVDLFEKAEKTIAEKRINENYNLGLASKVKREYSQKDTGTVIDEITSETVKEIFNQNIMFALYGNNDYSSYGFGFHCDREDGVDHPDLNWLLGCKLYTINFKNLYIHSTILTTEDTCEFMGIYIKWCTADHLGHGEFLLLPEDIENQEAKKEIEEGISVD